MADAPVFHSEPSTCAAREAAAESAQRIVALIRIAGHAILRRRVGRAGAGAATVAIMARVAAALPDSRVTMTAADLIEVAGEGDPERYATVIERLPATVGDEQDVDLLIGVAAGQGCDEVRLLEEAEHALSTARRERRTTIRRVGAVDDITLMQDLRPAVAAGQFFLLYQPKLHVRQQRIGSVEALIRWHHPVHGTILPGDFIPLAERSGAIAAMTLWTIGQVTADQRRLRAEGHDLRVFINIAGVLLSDARFVRDACGLIDGSDACIGFEITETSVIHDPVSAIANLNRFAALGIEVAIDDYGAGLSSLAYLKQLPARELKIDKLFITQLTSSHRDPLIVRSTIDLAHAMEMEVVAEGVETQTAFALLSVMGCDMVQGYLISRPIGLDALIAFLAGDGHLIARPDPLRMLGLGDRAA